jgi:hypothetical protein
MSKSKTPKSPHSGRRGNSISLAPLSADQALAAALKVKLSDVQKLEAEERAAKAKKKRR